MENIEQKLENTGSIHIEARVESIRYWKDDFGIILVSVLNNIDKTYVEMDRFNNVTVKGTMPQVHIDDVYHIIGTFEKNDKYGDQYNVKQMYMSCSVDEDDSNATKNFLSHLFTDNQIQALYSTLDNPYKCFVDQDLQKLVTVKGIGMQVATNMLSRFNESKYMEQIFIELSDYNLTNSIIKKLLDRYKAPEVVIDKLKENPYILCTEVKGIGFKTADSIALSSGMGKYSIARISAFILEYLNTNGDNGKSYISTDELLGALLDTLGDDVPDERITDTIHYLIDEEQLWYNEDKTEIGLIRYKKLADKIAEEIYRIDNAECRIPCDDIDVNKIVTMIESNKGWKYTSEQIEAVKLCLEHNFVVVTGMGGTGKTSIASTLVELFKDCYMAMCALSGRAGVRLQEVTQKTGSTIHRLLGYPCKDEDAKNKFEFHNENPLPHDIIIIDESSMIDGYLFYYLLRAIDNGAKVLCLGDIGQLQAIGCGNIIHDLIKSGVVAHKELTEIHRQALDSGIVTQSQAIRKGIQLFEKDEIDEKIYGNNKDFIISTFSDNNNTYKNIIQQFQRFLSEDDFNIMETQVLVPIKNRGNACTYKLNSVLQELYNPLTDNKKELIFHYKNGDKVLREGDKVINTQNNYKVYPNVYNGNLGIIREIDNEFGLVTIDFEQPIGSVVFSKNSLNAIELAYAITVHKSQGSEYKNVIVGIDFSSYSLLTRELLYTAITRAKKKCVLYAQIGALRFATSHVENKLKQTHLQNSLIEVFNKKESKPIIDF